MDMTPGQLPEDILPQHCRFPTSARRRAEKSCRKDVGIFDHKDLSTGWKKHSEPLGDLVQAAWALLLRSYVRNDSIYFAVLFTSSDGGNCTKDKKQTFLHGDDETLMLQYQFSKHVQLTDIHPVGSRKCRREGLDHGHINTAINFSTLLHVRNGHENGPLSRLMDNEKDVLINDVRYSLLP